MLRLIKRVNVFRNQTHTRTPRFPCRPNIVRWNFQWEVPANPFSSKRVGETFRTNAEIANSISAGCKSVFETNPESLFAKELAGFFDTPLPDNIKPVVATYIAGLFQLQGVGCDRNVVKGASLIGEAATISFVPALNKLGELYFFGIGVEKDGKKAFELFSKGTDNADGESQYWLGQCYKEGVGVEKDEKKAYELIKQSQEAGYPYGQLAMAERMLEESDGLQKAKAIKLLNQAAESYVPEANYLLGVCYLCGSAVNRDVEKAVKYLQNGVNGKNSKSMIELGLLYLTGTHLPRDPKKAYKLFKDAAALGNPCAQGLCYEYGIDHKLDVKKAAEFYGEGSSKGDHLATFHLAKCFERGDGVPLNMAHAFKILTKYAKMRHYLIDHVLGTCFLYGNGTNANPQMALTLLSDSASVGHLDSYCDLADCYMYGIGVLKDTNAAISFLHKAAEKGHPDAQLILGSRYQLGDGVEKNQQRALYYYTTAAKQGSPEAQYNVAFSFLSGFGVPKDEIVSVQLLKPLAEKGIPLAMCCLGVCYEHGLGGLTKDQQKAKELYQNAIKAGLHISDYINGCKSQGFPIDSEIAKTIPVESEVAELELEETTRNL